MRVHFLDFVFDGGRRILIRGADRLHLSPKAFRLLELLLARRPDAVSKPEIHSVLWPRTFVSEANLPALVNELRRALGDDAKRPRAIRTVHGFGYAFEATVREDAAPPAAAGSGHYSDAPLSVPQKARA